MPGNSFPRAKDPTTQIISIEIATGAVQIHTTGPGRKLSPCYLANGEIAYVEAESNGGVRFISKRKAIRGSRAFSGPGPGTES